MIKVFEATIADIAAITQARDSDPNSTPSDRRTLAYLKGEHHPSYSLPPRVIYFAQMEDQIVGYIAGQLTTRYDCDGELQYLWVSSAHRRGGIGSRMLSALARWFQGQEAMRICVDVEPGNLAARSFYSAHGAVELNPHWLVWPDMAAALLEK